MSVRLRLPAQILVTFVTEICALVLSRRQTTKFILNVVKGLPAQILVTFVTEICALELSCAKHDGVYPDPEFIEGEVTPAQNYG